MFQSLRPNNPIYILHKEGIPHVEMGMVVSVSNPLPKYNNPGMQPFGAPIEFVVDVVANVNGQQMTFQKLPANKDIEDSALNKLVISSSREAMNAEVVSLKQRSIDHINSDEFHKSSIVACDKILETLNPEFAEKQRRDKEIEELRCQFLDMSNALRELMENIHSEKNNGKVTKKAE